MYEAASLDGASRWRQFLKITLPMLTPVVFFNADHPRPSRGLRALPRLHYLQAATGSPVNSRLFSRSTLYQEAFAFFRMGYASALGLVPARHRRLLHGLLVPHLRYWVHYDAVR